MVWPDVARRDSIDRVEDMLSFYHRANNFKEKWGRFFDSLGFLGSRLEPTGRL
jgi:hypothetical protein